jgi:leucine dehydrogenase
MFDSPAFGQHEKTVHIHDEVSGLDCIIAIHSTARGPAAGGCRLWSYASAADALIDALRLSKGMSYKNAMADLPMGGGKAVILGPVDRACRQSVFEAFGAAVESLQGQYITAEDVGVSVADMITISGQTDYVSGIGGSGFDVGGDPSPYTALGVRRAIEAAVFCREQRSDIEGLRVAVQGIGNVGANLCRELSDHGAHLTIADIDDRRVADICDEYGAEQFCCRMLMSSRPAHWAVRFPNQSLLQCPLVMLSVRQTTNSPPALRDGCCLIVRSHMRRTTSPMQAASLLLQRSTFATAHRLALRSE